MVNKHFCGHASTKVDFDPLSKMTLRKIRRPQYACAVFFFEKNNTNIKGSAENKQINLSLSDSLLIFPFKCYIQSIKFLLIIVLTSFLF